MGARLADVVAEKVAEGTELEEPMVSGEMPPSPWLLPELWCCENVLVVALNCVDGLELVLSSSRRRGCSMIATDF